MHSEQLIFIPVRQDVLEADVLYLTNSWRRNMLNKLIRYFDINSNIRAIRPEGVGDSGQRKIAAWPQWLVLYLGVLIQPFFDGYKQTHHWQWQGFWGWVLFACITAFLVFPGVYRNSFDADKPLGVLLGPIFAAGIGWQSVIGTVLEAVTKK